MFTFLVTIEGIEGDKGTGYSKKESQQAACKLTLERLRKEPQFIDAVFSAKANRTKMEEEPVENVPDTEVKDDFIISQNTETKEPEKHENVFKEEVFEDRAVKKVNTAETTDSQEEDEFDLSDISAQPKIQSREDIIAAAEAAAFAEE